MRATNKRPTEPGWCWYSGDEVSKVCAVEVFIADPAFFGAGKLLANVPGYIYSPELTDLEGQWSEERLPAPPWPPKPIEEE